MNLYCDVAVIGAGVAGLAAERSARRTGAKTLIVDPDFSGHAAVGVSGLLSGLRRAGSAAVMPRLRAERDRLIQTAREEIDNLPASVVLRGHARYEDAATLVMEDGTRIMPRAVVIAAGSRPAVPEVLAPLGDLVLTDDTVLNLEDLPETLAVVGDAPDWARAMARLGVSVTVLDHVRRLGARIVAGVSEGKARLQWDGGAGLFDRVLVAAGRQPCLETLGLEAAGVMLDESGVPLFDPETLQCGDMGMFMAGDMDGEPGAAGAIAGLNAAYYPEVSHRSFMNGAMAMA